MKGKGYLIFLKTLHYQHYAREISGPICKIQI